MIHIQKSSLCTLDQNPLPRSHCAVSQGHPIRQVRSKKPSGRFYFSNRLGRRDFYPALTTRGAVMQRHPLTYPPSQLAGWQGQLSRAKSHPSRFIRVGRPDPPPCRANFSVSPTFFESLIHRAVMRENKMCLRRQMQTTTGADPPLRQSLNFFDQPRRVNHRTTRNQTGNFSAQDSRRNKVQNVLLLADFNRMPGIIPPLRPQDPIRLRRHHIEDFTLPFVSPLETENYRDGGLQRPMLVYSKPREIISAGLSRFRPSNILGVLIKVLILLQSSKRYSGHSVAIISTSAPSAT